MTADEDHRPYERQVPADVPEGILREIGRVVACGAWLETWLAALAASLRKVELDTDENLFDSYVHLRVSSVIQAIEQRAQLSGGAEQRVLTLLETVRPLLADRNKIVHGQWGAGERREHGGVVKFDKNGDIYFGFFEPAQLRELAHDLHAAAEEASELSLVVSPRFD